jgi:uroporphyrinogen decarboxylase
LAPFARASTLFKPQHHHHQFKILSDMKNVVERSLIAALEGKTVRPLPIWLMRQAGRYLPEYRALRAKAGSFWALCNNPELAAEVTLQPIHRFDFDAAIVFSDILTVPASFGQAVTMEEGVGPRLAPFDTELLRGAIHRDALQPVYETLALVRGRLETDKALIGFAGAPWTLATYMLGENGTPDERERRAGASPHLTGLLDVLIDRVSAHLIAQLKAGANVVQLFDSWAAGLTDEEFHARVLDPTRRIVAAVRDDMPGARIIGFPRACSQKQYAAYAGETGVNGVGIDTHTSIQWAVEAMHGTTCQGNLDPELLISGGRALDAAIESIVVAAGTRPFIFNLGHGVLPQTPTAHVEHLVKRVRALSSP